MGETIFNKVEILIDGTWEEATLPDVKCNDVFRMTKPGEEEFYGQWTAADDAKMIAGEDWIVAINKTII